jgi:hypothetical protein
MVLRLWWKEARVFWPLWVALGVAAALVQWFLLWIKLNDAKIGLLIVLGPSWALLYAFAAGAGVIAAERESNTQVLLDTLPVGRRMLWTNKVLFAIVTTVVLALVLTAMGVVGTAEYSPSAYPIRVLVLLHGVLLLEAIAWSLLWSLVVAALPAAIAGIVTVGVINVALANVLSIHNVDRHPPAIWVGLRLVLAAVALGVSRAVYTRGQRSVRAPAFEAKFSRLGFGLAPQCGRLAWETLRESRLMLKLLVAPWLFVVTMAALVEPVSGPRPDGLIGLGVLTGLFAGVSVFGPANRTRSYRFHAHHGIHPGLLWWTRLVAWGAVLTAMLTVAGLALLVLGAWQPLAPRRGLDVLGTGFLVFEAFVVALFTGQVVRRNITAFVVALLAFFLLVMPQLALYSTSMIPREGLVFFPLFVLAISWAWTDDWMNDLRGPGRWIRLAVMVGGAALVLVGSYIGYRAWSVPDIGSPFPPRPASSQRTSVPPDQDAAPDYTRIVAELSDLKKKEAIPAEAKVNAIVATGWDSYVDPWWRERQGLVERLRRAAAKPAASFAKRDRIDVSIDQRILDLTSGVLVLGLDSAERRARGDLAGAWDDLRAVFQMAHQLEQSGDYAGWMQALSWRTQALEWALAWAGDPRQTATQLRSAAAEFRALPQPAPATKYLEDEYFLCMDMLQRNPEVLSDYLVGSAPRWTLPRMLVTPWWERERAKRVVRLYFARRRIPMGSYLESTPLARSLTAHVTPAPDREDVLLGRAFEQVVALRIWQLEHEGHYPEKLEELVPGLLPSLPADPHTYSGRPFLYRRAAGQKSLPLGLSGLTQMVTGETAQCRPTRPGQWLLYSVGPDGRDDGAQHDYQINPAQSDLIFPLPPS